jgi:RNA-directed DNA polymerase
MRTKTEIANQETVDKTSRAAVALSLFWDNIDWDRVKRKVVCIQNRIVEATKNKRFNKVKALSWLLTRSFYAKLLAIKRVTESKGGKTPGIDGIIWKSDKDKFRAAKSLNQKKYKAKPLRRVFIPKKNGKLRPLGIPVITDRAYQALYKLVLGPIAEALADDHSYGFRPNRSCADAIEQCFNIFKWPSSPQWIMEADIKACFDNISHKWILKNIPLSKYMLKQWLKAGFIFKKKLFYSKSGTPQGGVISPVIANMVLDGIQNLLDKEFLKKEKVKMVRYADDFIITAISKDILEQRVKPLISKFLSERGLELSKEKTKITNLDEGFDFLGQNVRKYGKKLLTKPSKNSINSVYQKIREHVKANPTATTYDIIYKLNPVITGWANYHRHIVSKRIYSKLDNKVFRLIWNWCKRRHPNKSKQWVKNKYFKTIGKRNWVFSGKPKGGNIEISLAYFESTKIFRHVKIKGAANPYDREWHPYFQQRKERFTKRKGKLLLS